MQCLLIVIYLWIESGILYTTYFSKLSSSFQGKANQTFSIFFNFNFTLKCKIVALTSTKFERSVQRKPHKNRRECNVLEARGACWVFIDGKSIFGVYMNSWKHLASTSRWSRQDQNSCHAVGGSKCVLCYFGCRCVIRPLL